MGVVMAMKPFEKNLTGKCVLIQSDNTTVVCYINRNGGRSTLLSRMAEDLWKWCAARGTSCHAMHLLGLLNVRADIGCPVQYVLILLHQGRGVEMNKKRTQHMHMTNT